MQNQIQTIWHNPEAQSWENIYDNLVSLKVYFAVAAAASPATAAMAGRRAAAKPKIVLEHIFNWNITWWQSN